MTLPDERLNALRETKNFLYRLLDPRVTPRVPSEIRRDAGFLLKHYPDDMVLDQLPHHMGEYFSTKTGWNRGESKYYGKR